MHYRQIMDRRIILGEAIANRPRNLPLYLTNRLRELDQIIAGVAEAAKLIDANEADGMSVLRSAMRYGAQGTADEGAEIALYDLNDDLDRAYRLTDLLQALESYQRHGPEFLKYVMAALTDYVRPVSDQYRQTLRLLDHAEVGLQIYGYEPGNPEHEADPEYQSVRALLRGYRILAALLPRIERLRADLTRKLTMTQYMRGQAALGRLDSYRPEHGATETLYHATAYMPEILRHGFAAEPPEDRKGVGNFGRQDLISFTHDLEVARNIMRSLKELWLIAHGRLTGAQILGWANAEGIADQVRKAWRNETREPLPLGRDVPPGEVAKLYRNWQWFTKLRVNPVMLSPWEIVAALAKRAFDDIGVLSCQVRLEPTDQYLHAEAEFRLPADRVLTMKQVL